MHATVTDPVRPRDAMERLRRRFPHAVVLAFDPQGAGARPEGTYAERLRGLTTPSCWRASCATSAAARRTTTSWRCSGDALTAGRVAEVSA